jgi:hypothetical protein
MKVDWNPEPIQIGVFVGDGHGLGMLVLVRQRYDLEEQADIPPGCITVHLPPGTTVDLLDCVSNDPSRLYAYAITVPEDPAGPVRLTPRFLP